ncbi:MAG: DJ-1/PfpI family protein [Verrucomicrobiae bacterium]|jgi:protease I|nr:DJ-1/PfpI family protein [Verrucomicrobiae bacterium]
MIKPKISVIIEEHFDPGEYRAFNDFFPKQGYEVEYLSHLWGNEQLTFSSNANDGVVEESVTVATEIGDVSPHDYVGIILIGAYAMDRLRYQETVLPGQPNQAPAVRFLREALTVSGLKIGTICHSLWLFCADPAMLTGRKVTCAHNIVCDVENAGGVVQYEGDQTATLVIDGDLITGKHPSMVKQFMERFVAEIQVSSSDSV